MSPMKKGTGELPREKSAETEKEPPVHISFLPPEFDAFLSDSAAVIQRAAMTGQEVDALIKKRTSTQEHLENVRAREKNIRGALERFANPFDRITPSDYDGLAEAKIITKKEAEKFHTLDTHIQTALRIPHKTPELNATLELLTDAQSKVHEALGKTITEKQQWIMERIETAKNTVTDIYTKRAHTLISLLADIDSNPRVIERLKELKQEQINKKDVQEREIKMKVLRELTPIVKSMRNKHTAAFKRLADMLDNQNIKKELLDIANDEKKSQGNRQKYYRGIGWQLYRTILNRDDEKNQLRSLKEICPRLMPSGISYPYAQLQIQNAVNLAVLSDLEKEGDAQAKNLRIHIQQISRESVILQEIFDRKNRRTGANILLMALNERRENDQDGTTEKMRDIVKKGGFTVDVPQYSTMNGVRRMIEETKQGAVLLERTGDTWTVTEAQGAAKTEELIGKTSPLHMKQFPEWIQTEANRHFVRSGNDFTERLTYEDTEKE